MICCRGCESFGYRVRPGARSILHPVRKSRSYKGLRARERRPEIARHRTVRRDLACDEDRVVFNLTIQETRQQTSLYFQQPAIADAILE